MQTQLLMGSQFAHYINYWAKLEQKIQILFYFKINYIVLLEPQLLNYRTKIFNKNH